MQTPQVTLELSSLSRMRLVAYQGTPGAFGEEAVRAWRRDVEPCPVRTFDGVLDALASGAAEWAVIPVWNSIVGRVPQACDALDARIASVVQVAEIDVPVRQCLLSLPGTSIDDVHFVGSHPTALAQCTRLLAERSFVPCEAYNTAGAARELAALLDVSSSFPAYPAWYSHLDFDAPARLGVIASELAAHHYGLKVLLSDIQDRPHNVTRFAVLRAR